MSTDWSDQDSIAALALMVRHMRAFDERAALLAQRAELDRQITAKSASIAQVKTALAVFGLDTMVPGWSFPIRDAVDRDVFDAALVAAGRDPANHLKDYQQHKKTPAKKAPEAVAATDESVKVATLRLLAEAGDKGATATAIRDRIEAMRGNKLHYKTVGMTLYRLAQEKQAVRNGRTWFFVPPSAETKNPGGSAPGSVEARSNRKEVET